MYRFQSNLLPDPQPRSGLVTYDCNNPPMIWKLITLQMSLEGPFVNALLRGLGTYLNMFCLVSFHEFLQSFGRCVFFFANSTLMTMMFQLKVFIGQINQFQSTESHIPQARKFSSMYNQIQYHRFQPHHMNILCQSY